MVSERRADVGERVGAGAQGDPMASNLRQSTQGIRAHHADRRLILDVAGIDLGAPDRGSVIFGRGKTALRCYVAVT
jgi:hypothetical protein